MAVVQLAAWQPKPGRMQEFLGNAATAKKVHERLGAKVRVAQAALSGPTAGQMAYILECDDIVAWTTLEEKLQADAEWTTFVAQVIASPDPGSEFISNSLFQDTPGFEADASISQPGSIATIYQWRTKPGRLAEVLQVSADVQRIFRRYGGRSRLFTPLFAGPNSPIITFALEFDSFGAYGRATRDSANDDDFAKVAAVLQGADPPADFLASALLVEMAV